MTTKGECNTYFAYCNWIPTGAKPSRTQSPTTSGKHICDVKRGLEAYIAYCSPKSTRDDCGKVATWCEWAPVTPGTCVVREGKEAYSAQCGGTTKAACLETYQNCEWKSIALLQKSSVQAEKRSLNTKHEKRHSLKGSAAETTMTTKCEFYDSVYPKDYSTYIVMREYRDSSAINQVLQNLLHTVQSENYGMMPELYTQNGYADVFSVSLLRTLHSEDDAKLKQAQIDLKNNWCQKLMSDIAALVKALRSAIQWIYKHLACPIIKKAINSVIDDGKETLDEEAGELCAELGGELAAACEIVGLGPEDPLADACAIAFGTVFVGVCEDEATKLINKLGNITQSAVLGWTHC